MKIIKPITGMMKIITKLVYKRLFWGLLLTNVLVVVWYKAQHNEFGQMGAIPLPPSLRDVYLVNQRTRESVKNWIEDKDYASPPSLFNYGLPTHFRNMINLNVGNSPIGHDLVSWLGEHLIHNGARHVPRRLNYLEIGVSVGKCLMTQLEHFGRRAIVVAFDVEEINPSFAAMLQPGNPLVLGTWTEERLRPGAVTLRRIAGSPHVDTIKAFTSPSGGELRYLASDEFNLEGWLRLRALAGQSPFELIYSDAFHTYDALLFEAEQLLQLGLINFNNFAIVWDDCAGDMLTDAACPILQMLRKAGANAPKISFALYHIGGWLGVNEVEHGTCIATTLNLKDLHVQDADFSLLKNFAPCE